MTDDDMNPRRTCQDCGKVSELVRKRVGRPGNPLQCPKCFEVAMRPVEAKRRKHA